MYPAEELARLANRKIAVRRRIDVHRSQCAEAAGQLARPIAWMDRAIALGRRILPLLRFIALPLGLFVTRRFFPRTQIPRILTRWGPLIRGAVLGARSLVRSRKA